MKEFVICFSEAVKWKPGMIPKGRSFGHYKSQKVIGAVKQFRETHEDFKIHYISMVLPKEEYEHPLLSY